MAQNEILNKRLSIEKIFEIADLLQKRNDYYVQLYRERAAINDYKMQDMYDESHDIRVSTRPRIEYSITTKDRETETREDDVEWFKNCIEANKQFISAVGISYYVSIGIGPVNEYRSANESMYMKFYEDSITFSVDKSNAVGSTDYDAFVASVGSILESLPPRLDDTIKKKYIRSNIPSLNIGFALGIIIALTLGLLCKFTNIDIYINDFVTGTHYFMLAVIGMSFAVGLVIPGVNHGLYRKIKIRQIYQGYNRSSKTDIYADDLVDFKNKCEVEIGDFAEYTKIRKKIEKNYKKSKIILLVELVLFAAVWLVLALI